MRLDSPTDGWDAVERVHGRLRLMTPVTSPIAANLYTLAARERRRKWGKRVLVMTLLGLAAALAFGCAHQPAAPNTITLPERIGSVAALAIRAAVGQEPKAVTIPGGPTVVFQPADADDVCLAAHEGQHRIDQADMGTVSWTLAYVDQYLECVGAGKERAWCLRSMPLEAVAYQQQHACQEARAAGLPWPPVSAGPRWRDGWSECMAKGGGR